jgi:hypothetical protein
VSELLPWLLVNVLWVLLVVQSLTGARRARKWRELAEAQAARMEELAAQCEAMAHGPPRTPEALLLRREAHLRDKPRSWS